MIEPGDSVQVDEPIAQVETDKVCSFPVQKFCLFAAQKLIGTLSLILR